MTHFTGSLTLTNLVSSIVWNWNTNYWIEAITSGDGQVSGGHRWVVKDASAMLIATPDSGLLFMGWSGDAAGDYTEDSILIPMVRPVSVTATFSDDADGDGLLNTNEAVIGTDPRNGDSDGDGQNDGYEVAAGTSPTNSASLLAVRVSVETNSTLNEVSWYGVEGRYYQLEYADSITDGLMAKGSVVSGSNAVIRILDVTAGEQGYYRIRVSDSPAGL